MLESSFLQTYNKEKRGFEAIGWYCKKCKTFETDYIIEHCRKEDIKNTWNLKTDADIDKFVRLGYVESIILDI